MYLDENRLPDNNQWEVWFWFHGEPKKGRNLTAWVLNGYNKSKPNSLVKFIY